MTQRPVFVISSDTLGRGSDELGQLLIRGMFKTMTTVEPLPEKIIFLNAGVILLTREDILENIQQLEEKSVQVLACGTCLDYFNLKNKVKTSWISNMKEILTTLSNAAKVVNF